jgi:hypothetical protein
MSKNLTNNMQEMKDPYYWRNKVMSWKSLKEAEGQDSRKTWVEEIVKERPQDQTQNQSALSKLWYKEGMQIDLNSNTPMSESLKAIMSHIRDIISKEKENGTNDILKDISDDSAKLIDDSEELKLKALAISAIAEADGHAPEAKKILDQAGSEKRKKLKTDPKLSVKPSSHDNGR